jgi:mRNA interferase MazF
LVRGRIAAPARGDIVWLDLDPQAGHGQAGRFFNDTATTEIYTAKVGLALCCPITSRRKGYPFEVALPDGLQVAGVILSDQLKSLDWRARSAKRAGTVPEDVLEEVLGKIAVLVGPS